MYSLTDIVRRVSAPFANARTCVVAAALVLGCGVNGDQLLGTVRADQSPIYADSGAGNSESGPPCTDKPSYEAREVGGNLALHLTIDRSSNMADPRNDKWDALASGLIRFLNSPAANGLSVGVEYFPAVGDTCRCPTRDCMCFASCGCPCDAHGDPPRNCGVRFCDPNSYRRADIEIAPLSQNGGTIDMSLFGQMPSGPATLRPALQGALAYAASFQALRADTRVVELVIAGGPPASDCAPSGINDCADVAAASNIRTNVVAFDFDGTPLDPIITRGGGRLFSIDSHRDDVSMRFGGIVASLRDDVQHCQYEVPPPIAPADLPKVTLDITRSGVDAGARPTMTPYPRLASREACGSVGGQGWFYDRIDNPTRIVACDNLCKTIRSTDVTVSIGGGCSAPPPTP